MLHGQAADNQQWIDLGLIDNIDLLIDAKVIQPMIIVMPYEVSWRTGPEESNFGAALINDVIPFMEENYRACAERACRAIGGLSRGGNWAVYLGFQYPEVFAAVGAHSAPLFYGELGRI
jgi:enterochelin esterase-like enzyme